MKEGEEDMVEEVIVEVRRHEPKSLTILILINYLQDGSGSGEVRRGCQWLL